MEMLKLLSANELVAQIISFLILLILLRIFVWKKILNFLDKRKERIASEFKKIEETRADIEKMKLDYDAKLSSIEQTAQLKMHDAANESKLIFEDARKKANIQAQEIIDSAKSSIKYELAKAKDELKNDIIDMTIKATEDLIKEKITGDEDRKLVKDFIDGINKIE